MNQPDGPDWLAALARRAGTEPAPELERYRLDGTPGGRPSAILLAIADSAPADSRTADSATADARTAAGHAPGSPARGAAVRGSAEPGPDGGAPGAAGGGPDPGPDGAAVLLVQRSDRLREHPAEVTFPGGSLDAGEGPRAAAVREAGEETGLPAGGLRLVGTLPVLRLAWTDYLVTPVLAHWPGPAPELVPDGAEITRASWVPLASLADPAGRFQVRYPTGYVGPAFLVAGTLVWGFTGSLIGWLLRLAGRDRGFDQTRIEDLKTALTTYGGGFGR
ncbi:MAG TPA: CoA pyrophosphatase [Mycobacteriales bacterium]|nr:CoA pyrophosphatase [Mycobacteriales bacterium]